MPKDAKTAHPMHDDDLPRISRAAGQIEGVKKMIEEGRYCPDILTQLRAIRSALKSVEANILERHLNHCVTAAIEGQDRREARRKLDELKDIFKRYED